MLKDSYNLNEQSASSKRSLSFSWNYWFDATLDEINNKSSMFPEANDSSDLERHYRNLKKSLASLPNHLRSDYHEQKRRKEALISAETNERRMKY